VILCVYVYKLVINVTAACGRGHAVSAGLLVTKEKTEQKKGKQTEEEQWMGIQGIMKEM